MKFSREDEEQPADAAGGTGEGGEEPAATVAPVKRSAWARPGTKKTHKGGAGAKNKHKAAKVKQPVTQKHSTDSNKTTTQEKPSTSKDQLPADSDAESGADDSENETEKNENEKNENSDRSSDDEKKVSSVEDDDVEWEKFQQKLNKREKLEGKSKVSHSVHSPTFPEDKQEYWWTYICDRKSRTLLTAPYHVTNLVDHEEVQLKFTAPRWPGVYTFTVCLRSGKSCQVIN